MNIFEKEEQLFEKWRKVRPNLVKDGVVDEAEYLKSEIKILFVLKEVNDPDGGGWDLRELIRIGERTQTWNNIFRWVYGIRNLGREVPWKELEEVSTDQRKDILKSICALNVKKIPGGHTADNQELYDVSSLDKEYLIEQFNIYNPDLVICCGSVTSDIFNNLVLAEQQNWNMTSRGVWYNEFEKKKYLISFSHPEARVNDALLYYGIVDAVKEIYR